MFPIEIKAKFIDLRAQGKSFRACAEALNVNKDTCRRWEAEFKNEISERKAEEFERLYEQYNLTRKARITQLGEAVKTIDGALADKGLQEANPERLLEIKLKYLLALKDEYLPATNGNTVLDTGAGNHLETALNALKDLLGRIRTGEATAEQASKESTVINSILKAIEVKDLKQRVELLESVLSAREK